MSEQDLRVRLFNTLLTTPHGDLELVYRVHQEVITQDPRFYVHLAAWYADHGEVRDHKEMFVVNLILSDFPGHREVGLALLREMPPYQVGRVFDFIKGRVVRRRVKRGDEYEIVTEKWGLFRNVPRSMKTEITRYLREREADPEWFDSAVLQARKTLKRLYASLHIAPSPRAQAILFDDNPPPDSRLYALKQIARAKTPAQQARAIVKYKIPYRVAASVIQHMTPTVLVALIERMTPQEVINNLGSLKRHGAFDNPEVKALIERKLEQAKTDERVSAYKAKVAAEAAGVSEEVAEQLDAVTEARVRARGTIVRSTALLIDKCVVGDTLICTEYGLLPISSFAPSVKRGVTEVGVDVEVATRGGKARATKLYLNGVKPVRYIETEKGYRLGASLNHPILCYDPSTAELVWKKVCDLKIGDYVALRRNTQCFGPDLPIEYEPRTPYQPFEAPLRIPDRMTPELARWLGYIVAEGQITSRPASVRFVSHDQQLIADFCDITEKVFGLATTVTARKGSSVVEVRSEELLHFLKEALGFEKNRARDCYVPLSVLSSSEAVHREFLRGYFAGDGGLATRRGRVLAATSASEQLLRTIQIMLLNFGIVSRLRPTRSYATNSKSPIAREYWRLTIGGTDALRFVQRIGFASDLKHASIADVVVNSRSLTWSARWDSVPELAKTAAELLGRGTWHALRHLFPTVACFRGRAKDHRVPTDLLPSILEKYPRFADVGDIREIVESQLFLDPIIRIEEGQEPVYDLHVPGDHSFVSNGMVSHNSGSMHESIEIGKRIGAMIAGICEADLYVYAFDTIGYPIEVAGPSLADWERALMGIEAGGWTSCGVAVEMMRRQGQVVEQIVMVTDEGENTAPYFVEALQRYREELKADPHIVFVKTRGASNHLERECRRARIPFDTYQFTGDYYALPNLVPLLTRPSKLDLLLEIMAYPLPQRRDG